MTAVTRLRRRGSPDRLVLATQSGRVRALGPDGAQDWEVDLDGPVRDLAAGDLDGDGRDELAAVVARRVTVLTGEGDLRLVHDCQAPPQQLSCPDLDGDGAHELLVAMDRELMAWAPDGHCRAEVTVEDPRRILPLGDARTAFLVQSGSQRLVRVTREGRLAAAFDAPGPVRAACPLEYEGRALVLVGCANGTCGMYDLEGAARFLVDLKSPVRLLHAPARPTPEFVAAAVTEEGRVLALDQEGTPSFALEPRGKGLVSWIQAGDLHPDPGPELLAVTDQGAWFLLGAGGVPLGRYRLERAPHQVAVLPVGPQEEARVAFAFADGLLEIRGGWGGLCETYQYEQPITALVAGARWFWLGLGSGELLALDGDGVVRQRRQLPGAPRTLAVLSDQSLFAVLPHRWVAQTPAGDTRWSLPVGAAGPGLAVSPGPTGAALLLPAGPGRLACYQWPPP